MEWIVQRDGNRTVVSGEESLREWASKGGVRHSDLVYHPALQRWLYAHEVLEIRDALSSAGETADELSSTAAASTESRRSQASNDYLIRQGNSEYRAPNLETLQAWASEGRVLPDASVYDPERKRWMFARAILAPSITYGTPSLNVRELARNYRHLVGTVGLQLVLSLFALSDSLSMLLLPGLVATSVALSYFAYRTADSLASQASALWAVAMFVPCINLITLLVLSSNATSACRAAGIRVGLLGPEL